MPITEVLPIEPLAYPELWILERAVEIQATFSLKSVLDTEEEQLCGFSAAWNAPAIGATPQQVAAALWSLWRHGQIKFAGRARPGCWQSKISPTSSNEIEEWLSPEHEGYHCYSITSQGVARWERHSMPDWDRYIPLWDTIECDNRQFIGESIWSSVATNEALARRDLQIYADDMASQLSTIHWECVRVEQFAPLIAMPGKVLPHGVRVVVPVTNYGNPQDLAEWPLECQDRQFAWDVHAWDAHNDALLDLGRWYANGTGNHPDRPAPRSCESR